MSIEIRKMFKQKKAAALALKVIIIIILCFIAFIILSFFFSSTMREIFSNIASKLHFGLSLWNSSSLT